MSYMNHSGDPVRSVATFYKVPLEAILVAYDELDFPAGVVRLQQGGGAAGHNGLRDVIAQMGDDFWRLRIGIGHPGDRSQVLDYVLGRPPRRGSAADPRGDARRRRHRAGDAYRRRADRHEPSAQPRGADGGTRGAREVAAIALACQSAAASWVCRTSASRRCSTR